MIVLSQLAHQGCKPNRMLRDNPLAVLYWETDRVDAHAPRTGTIGTVEAIDGIDHGLNGTTREIIAEHIEADALIRGVEPANRRLDNFYRARIGKRLPTGQALDDGSASCWLSRSFR